MQSSTLIALAISSALPLRSAAAPVRDAAWVEQRVAAWQPSARERRWEQIGWAPDIHTAERLATQHRRAVFLFTHDGRLNVGRC